ncbi:aminomethyltransferase family protein [Roseovarius aestuariivivens]|uniref:aminomethyltransferase family protein n=1 Tax=Roseovarius aestuariivivens TaxID=1888910 RepID=UPI00108119DF|nr:aminomethyltransferase family protein [Roseovarius aestuariivivens]
MMRSSDGQTRDLVTSRPGAGWDFNLNRHAYHAIEARHGPHYCVYNRRLMCVYMDDLPTDEGYWLLRTKAACLHTGEWPIEFVGPDAEKLMSLLFVNNISKVRVGRCGYGIACFDHGGLIVDGVFVRLAEDRFWYAQADGDFVNWARAHAKGMDVQILDPHVNVSQIQGPSAMEILKMAAKDGVPEPFGYFGSAWVDLGGQRVLITRTGYTNELGWEFYTEPHHDAKALWEHIERAGAPYGLRMFGLDSMNIRRIEAGILNANSDFDETTTPYDVGLGGFVAMDKDDFIGKAALEKADKRRRLYGIICPDEEPRVNGRVEWQGKPAGRITAGATSPYLGHGIGYALMDSAEAGPGTEITVEGNDGKMYAATLAETPLYDKACEIPRGKLVDIPERAA